MRAYRVAFAWATWASERDSVGTCSFNSRDECKDRVSIDYTWWLSVSTWGGFDKRIVSERVGYAPQISEELSKFVAKAFAQCAFNGNPWEILCVARSWMASQRQGHKQNSWGWCWNQTFSLPFTWLQHCHSKDASTHFLSLQPSQFTMLCPGRLICGHLASSSHFWHVLDCWDRARRNKKLA